jgi:diaminohydroxyphosphoribosylaminopyrimidine deaminase/5-amino-6-(5-phosphoribosylamino)uracil reductase
VNTSSAADQRYMARAIELAYRGLYTTSPNPRVGCVLVRDGEVIGEGWHIRAGEGHAEVNALASVSDVHVQDIKGATAYVTLEPCSHQGKTPPCCQALIDAQVGRVVVAMEDPNPLVAGRGNQALKDAGIDVLVGVMESEAQAINPGFIKRMAFGLPLLRCKLAMSLDGRTAMASGESQWITGADARSDVQRLRARSCAVMSGVDTVIVDEASLTVRADQLNVENAELIAQRQPLRVVLDSTLRLQTDVKLLQQAGPVLIVAAKADAAKQEALEQAGAEVLVLANDDGQVDLPAVLNCLAERQCNEVLLEAGATLAGAFMQAELLDELVVYMAPTLLGSEARPLMALPLNKMSEQKPLEITAITPVGKDWRIDAKPVKGAH